MTREGLTLKQALARIRAARPEAPPRPNDGFMTQLIALEARERPGEPPSVAFKPRRPPGVTCPHCGQVVGISKRALESHLKQKHPDGGGGDGNGKGSGGEPAAKVAE